METLIHSHLIILFFKDGHRIKFFQCIEKFSLEGVSNAATLFRRAECLCVSTWTLTCVKHMAREAFSLMSWFFHMKKGGYSIFYCFFLLQHLYLKCVLYFLVPFIYYYVYLKLSFYCNIFENIIFLSLNK